METQQDKITNVCIIILGMIVLVFLIYGFMTDWEFLKEQEQEPTARGTPHLKLTWDNSSINDLGMYWTSINHTQVILSSEKYNLINCSETKGMNYQDGDFCFKLKEATS